MLPVFEKKFVFDDGEVWSETRLQETLLASKGSKKLRTLAVIEPYRYVEGSEIPGFYHCRLYSSKEE